MTLGTLTLYVAIVALLFTIATPLLKGKVKNYPLSFLQHFCGVLFVFSGWVKAVDPLGTAYKMEQYFAEFETTFADTAFSFLSPMFPVLAEAAIGFSVFMIVFEILLGLMLILGAYRKVTAWAFLLLVVFFLFLTGFTYLTGYVPEGVNFFAFSQWGPYVETNMKVTDCGCFGDFIKLKPGTSFMKDVVLLVPALLFVLFSGKMHQLFSPGARNGFLVVSTLGLLLYCFSNYVWDIPHLDFRPFKVGVDIAERKAAEEEAMANIQVTGYRLTHKADGEVVELPFDEYMKKFKDYPSEEWEIEQIKSEPAIEPTKISDFEINDLDGNDVTDGILSQEGYTFLIIAHKIYGDASSTSIMIQDTVYATDTIREAGEVQLVKRVDDVRSREIDRDVYSWDDPYLKRWTEVVNPVMDQVLADGHKVAGVVKFDSPSRIDDFRHATQSGYPFFVADDILLKTIVRSNPGIVLLKEGEVVAKWHYRKLPDYEELAAEYLK